MRKLLTLFLNLLLFTTVFGQIPQDIVLNTPMTETTTATARKTVTLDPGFYAPIGFEFSANINTNLLVELQISGNDLTAIPDGGDETYTYQWSTGETTPSITTTGTGIYSVKVTEGLGEQVIKTHDFATTTNNFDHNFIKTETVLVKDVRTETDVDILNENQKSTVYNYFDGLGRSIQTVAVKTSPAKNDLIQHIEYDMLGRKKYDYLPYAKSSEDGAFHKEAYTEQRNFHFIFPDIANSVYPYSEKVFDNSPLNRVMEQGAPGDDWQVEKDIYDISTRNGHTIKNNYLTNTVEDGVIIWTVNNSGNLINSGDYTEGSLYKFETIDENNNSVFEFTNLTGKTILKVSDYGTKELLTDDLLTYYIYDDFGLLRYVLPPKAIENIGAVTTFNTSDPIIRNLCYYYEYDNRKRMTIKKLPGADEVYLVYDDRDRPVLTQNGNLRTHTDGTPQNNWMFTKYDELNRPILTGIYYDAVNIGQQNMQTYVECQIDEEELKYYEEKSGNYADYYFGYTNESFPVLDIQETTPQDEILTITYYDNYYFDVNSTIRSYCEGIDDADYPAELINDNVKGLVTGTLTKVLGTANDYLMSLSLYDDKYRVLRTYNETYLGGDDLLLTKYDFIGTVLKTKQIHLKDGKAGTLPVTINRKFEYDHTFRLKEVYHQISNNPEILIASYEYNELGQVIKKKLNENIDGSFLQEIDYEYNIRGWTTKINDPDDLGNDKFAMELLYNDILPNVNDTNDEQYNGNIAAIKWNTPEFGLKAYGYGYDNTNRLERAKFAAGSAFNVDVDKYSVENITYDANGNILTLGRHNTAVGYIDNLTMTYDGNQLKKKHDSGDLALGFVDMVDYETEYQYDNNSSMCIDDNKGITLTYNHLNIPEEIVGGNDTVRYIYDANGTKISKDLVQGGVISYTDYIGDFVYKDGDLDYITINEGRITQPTTGTFQYEYFLKDHLDNTRTVFADGNGDGVLADNEVLQENHYYPFGLDIGDLTVDRGADSKIKYNGKELQDDELNGISLNYYDYGDRFKDDFRWNVIDNKAEKYYSSSPYVYAGNNPILFVDYDGNDYGVSVNHDSKTITISANYVAPQKAQKMLNKSVNTINSASGKNVFVAGGKAALKNGSTKSYSVNFNLTTDVANGDKYFTDQRTGENTKLSSQADFAASDNASDVVNGFNVVSDDGTAKAGGADSNTIDIEGSSTTVSVHEIGHTLGIGHSDGVMEAVGATGTSYSENQVGEILAGVGIGGTNSSTDDRPGKGKFFGNQTNAGLDSGEMMSAKKYNRLVKRYERRNKDKE